MCVYIYIYIYVHTHTYMYLHVYIYICVYIYIYMHTYMYVYAMYVVITSLSGGICAVRAASGARQRRREINYAEHVEAGGSTRTSSFNVLLNSFPGASKKQATVQRHVCLPNICLPTAGCRHIYTHFSFVSAPICVCSISACALLDVVMFHFPTLLPRHVTSTCALDCCYTTCAPQPISFRLGLDPENNHTIEDLYEIARKQNLSFETLISIPGTHKCWG